MTDDKCIEFYLQIVFETNDLVYLSANALKEFEVDRKIYYFTSSCFEVLIRLEWGLDQCLLNGIKDDALNEAHTRQESALSVNFYMGVIKNTGFLLT